MMATEAPLTRIRLFLNPQLCLSDSTISPSTRSVFMERGFKNIWIRYRIHQMRVDGSRIRKEKVVDSKIYGYVWTGPECVRRLAEVAVCGLPAISALTLTEEALHLP